MAAELCGQMSWFWWLVLSAVGDGTYRLGMWIVEGGTALGVWTRGGGGALLEAMAAQHERALSQLTSSDRHKSGGFKIEVAKDIKAFLLRIHALVHPKQVVRCGVGVDVCRVRSLKRKTIASATTTHRPAGLYGGKFTVATALDTVPQSSSCEREIGRGGIH